jgi:hypothetical protein
MTCAVNCLRQRSLDGAQRAGRQHGAQNASVAGMNSRFEISGTWDFKWPRGSKIRVAFQKLPEAMVGLTLAPVKDVVIQHAAKWADVLPAGSVTFEFLETDLDAPLGEPKERDARPEPDRQRSPFEPNTASAPLYDVLVSLADLPLTLFDEFRGAREVERVVLPFSELGTYARRADYGTPTIYLGRFGDAVQEKDPSAFVRYFQSPLAAHIIVHEFGHVLGLPHTHQHPRLVPVSAAVHGGSIKDRRKGIDEERKKFYRSEAEIRKVIAGMLGVELSDEAIQEQLLNGWRGNEAFSDWLDLSRDEVAAHEADATLPSVMTFPYYGCMKKGHPGCSRCQGVAPFDDAFTAPQPHDIDMLRRMYVPGAERRAATQPPPSPPRLRP